MAERISEIMNRDVLSFGPSAAVRSVLELMLVTGVTAAPVIDRRGHPIGVVSMRELVRARRGALVRDVVRTPAMVASGATTLRAAAGLLDQAGVHHLVVLEPDGSVAGFVSSLDLLRGLIGAPARHPDTFLHWQPEAGTAFSNDLPLDPEHVGGTPHAPGLVVLLHGGAGRPELVVHVESTLDIKRWLFDFLSAPIPDVQPRDGGALRYRYTEISDEATRMEIGQRVREQVEHDTVERDT